MESFRGQGNSPRGVLQLQGGDPGDVEELRLFGAGGAVAAPRDSERAPSTGAHVAGRRTHPLGQ